jgi:hypothetical protein
MADDVDHASELIENTIEGRTRVIREKAASIPKGVAGICEECELYNPRLVGGLCSRCRDNA